VLSCGVVSTHALFGYTFVRRLTLRRFHVNAVGLYGS